MAPARDAARLAGCLALAISAGSGMWLGLAVPPVSAGGPSSIPPGPAKTQPTPAPTTAPTIAPSPGRSQAPRASAAIGAAGPTATEAGRGGAAPIVRGRRPGDGPGEPSILLAIAAVVGGIVAALGALLVLSRRRRRGVEATVAGEPLRVRSTGSLATNPEGGPAGPRDPLVAAFERSRPGIAGAPASTVHRPAWVTRLAAQATGARRAGSGVLVPPGRDPSDGMGEPPRMADRPLDGSPRLADGRPPHPPPRRLG